MTEKPNSVCKHCGFEVEFISDRWIKVVTDGVYCDKNPKPLAGHTFGLHEPVAEPAEPPEQKCTTCGSSDPSPGLCSSTWHLQSRRSPAPQPVAGFDPQLGQHFAQKYMREKEEAESLREGTPKLEEGIVAATEEIWDLLYGTEKYDQWDIGSIIRKHLRPFITPSCQKDNLCGTANAPILTNADTHPIVDTVEHLEAHLLPDEEWKSLSLESREKISKWFSLAEKYLQAILDAATPASTGGKENLNANIRNEVTRTTRELGGRLFQEAFPQIKEKIAAGEAGQYEAAILCQEIERLSTGEANGWISVEERVPEESEIVLLFQRDGIASVTTFGVRDKGKWLDYNNTTDDYPNEIRKITHWQRLPPAPTSVPQAEPPK